MPTLHLTTFISAPPERVFDLSRSIDLHMAASSPSGERAIAGVTSGLIGPGQSVTWRARHFGVWQELSVRMTAFERPHFFEDEMVKGAFARMKHRHAFAPEGGGTLMQDTFEWASPLGPLGWLANVLFLKRHMRKFILERNGELKWVAESEAWRKYVEI